MITSEWRKSSRSFANGDCIEVRLTPDWRKSSRSYTDSCVEARLAPVGVQVRDSKDTAGPVLSCSRDQWVTFLKQFS